MSNVVRFQDYADRRARRRLVIAALRCDDEVLMRVLRYVQTRPSAARVGFFLTMLKRNNLIT